jgi:hypothetical protein
MSAGVGRPTRLARLTAGALTALLGVVSPAPAQAPRVPFGQDNHAFRFILKELQLEPLSDLLAASEDPAHTVVIVCGQTAALENFPGGLAAFVEAGGALLVATDRPTADVLDDDFGVRVTGRLVKATAPGTAYRNLEDCPFVEGTDKEPRLLEGLGKVAANRASFLMQTPRMPVLAQLPRGCRVEGFPKFMRLAKLPFAAGGTYGKGRVLVLADHSVFINDMMLQSDDDNFDFTFNCLRWLTGPDGQRTRVAYLNEGRAVTDFDVPLDLRPELPRPTAEVVDRLLVGLEEDNVFNRLILRYVSRRQLLGGVAVVLTAVLFGFGFHRLAKARYQVEPAVPAPVADAAEVLPPDGLMDQRHQAMLREGRLWEAARDLARQALAGIGHDPLAAPAGTAAPPAVTVQAGVRQARHLRVLVRRLWRIAHDPLPRKVSPRQYARLVGQAEQVRAAWQDGRLHLDGTGNHHA